MGVLSSKSTPLTLSTVPLPFVFTTFSSLTTDNPELVWSEGRTCREDAALLVATQTRRAHEWRELACLDIGEPPDQPEVAKPLDTTQGIGIAVLGLEDDGALRPVTSPALARNPELRETACGCARWARSRMSRPCHRSFEFGQDMPRIRACFRTRFAIHCEAAAELARKERVLRQSSRPLRMNRSSAQDADARYVLPYNVSISANSSSTMESAGTRRSFSHVRTAVPPRDRRPRPRQRSAPRPDR